MVAFADVVTAGVVPVLRRLIFAPVLNRCPLTWHRRRLRYRWIKVHARLHLDGWRIMGQVFNGFDVSLIASEVASTIDIHGKSGDRRAFGWRSKNGL